MIGVPQAHSDSSKLYIYAAAILAGTVVQVMLPVPWLRGRDDRLRLVIDWHDPAVWRTLKLMIPVTLSLGLINVNAVVDTFFASRLLDPNLAPAAIDKAFRVYMLPQGMFSVAVATILFPTLSRLSARDDWDGFRDTVSLGLRQIAFLLVPASAVIAVLADPIVRLLYQRGAFTPHQTTVVAAALVAFTLGLTFNGTMLLLNRSFFSLQSNWVPTAIALGNLFVNGVLDAFFYRFGVWGIPLSTSVVNLAGTVALVWVLRRRLGRLDLGALVTSLTRVVVASGVAAAVGWGVWDVIDSGAGRSFLGQIVSLLPALTLAGVAYLGACKALQVRELDAVTGLLRRRSAG